ncbi:unnamed protein product [Pieris macdunnoughi]|uniref:Uncharacterized protein n=1 Tax=Pieris macdunnoughi TaxID=345717 RepID=A0A821WBM0_9NEOP|nr:unnamed protein product [Pieris macdunnoughi]
MDGLEEVVVAKRGPASHPPRTFLDYCKMPGNSLTPIIYKRLLTTFSNKVAPEEQELAKHKGYYEKSNYFVKQLKKLKHTGSEYDFVPFGVETPGPWGPSAIRLFKEIAKWF